MFIVHKQLVQPLLVPQPGLQLLALLCSLGHRVFKGGNRLVRFLGLLVDLLLFFLQLAPPFLQVFFEDK